MAKAQEFLTPVGRLVQGDCFEAQTKDQAGNPLTIKTGANAGQPTQKYFIAVAFKKTDPGIQALKANFEQVARTAFPALFPVPGGPCANPNFAWKIVDGDGLDTNGKPNSSKEGFAGCWVFRFSSSYAPKCYAAGKYAPHEQLTDPKSIPRGHFVRVAGTVSDNIPSNKPGLYVNLNMIEWASIGDVIVSGPDASLIFGGSPLAAAVAPPPAAIAPPAPAPAPPASVAVAPHPGILTGGPVMLPAAGGVTYAAYISAGWKDADLVAAGFMAPSAPAPAPLPPGGSAPPPPAPAPIAAVGGKVMLPPAGATTYAEYIGAGWTDTLLIQNGYMAA